MGALPWCATGVVLPIPQSRRRRSELSDLRLFVRGPLTNVRRRRLRPQGMSATCRIHSRPQGASRCARVVAPALASVDNLLCRISIGPLSACWSVEYCARPQKVLPASGSIPCWPSAAPTSSSPWHRAHRAERAGVISIFPARTPRRNVELPSPLFLDTGRRLSAVVPTSKAK
jgi:hypothetical protein